MMSSSPALFPSSSLSCPYFQTAITFISVVDVGDGCAGGTVGEVAPEVVVGGVVVVVVLGWVVVVVVVGVVLVDVLVGDWILEFCASLEFCATTGVVPDSNPLRSTRIVKLSRQKTLL
jgi:hypothetical protein